MAKEIEKEIDIELKKHDKIQRENQKLIDELKSRLNQSFSIEKERLIELEDEIDRLQHRRAVDDASKQRRD